MCFTPTRSRVRSRASRRLLPKTGCRGVGLPVVLAVGRGCLAEAGSLPIVKCGSGGLRCDRLEEDHVRSSHEQ